MVFESGECVTAGCINLDARDNVTIKVAAFVLRIEDAEPDATFALNGPRFNCLFVDGGEYQTIGNQNFCATYINFDNLTEWDITQFSVYRDGTPVPPFYVAPARTPPNVFPNSINQANEVVAAAVDCEGFSTATAVRWAWSRPTGGPCYFDPEYSVTLCSTDGVATGNSQYFDINGVQLPDTAIVKDVFCPPSF